MKIEGLDVWDEAEAARTIAAQKAEDDLAALRKELHLARFKLGQASGLLQQVYDWIESMADEAEIARPVSWLTRCREFLAGRMVGP